jgi:diguanylate cyclase (GGDEF)-like protein
MALVLAIARGQAGVSAAGRAPAPAFSATFARILRHALLCALACSGLHGGAACQAATGPLAQASAPQTLHFVVLAFRPKAQTLAQWQPVVDYLNRSSFKQRFVLDAVTYPEMEHAIKIRQADIVLTQPADYVHLAYVIGLYSPLATLVEQDGNNSFSEFGGVIVTLASRTDIRSLADLKGKRIAVSQKESLGGYLMQANELLKAGVDPDRDITVTELGMPHDRAVAALLAGRADVAFVRTGVLEGMARDGTLDLARLSVIKAPGVPAYPLALSTQLYPEWALATMPWVQPDLAKKICLALLALDSQSPAAKAAKIHGFTIPGDYHAVEKMMRALHAPPFDKRPPVTWKETWSSYSAVISIILLLTSTVLLFLLFALGHTQRRLRHDIVQRMRAEERIAHLAYHDQLTGLPNRALFLDRLQQALAAALRAGRHGAAMFIDLDQFKHINDFHGHQVGDAVLCSVGQLISSVLRQTDTVARFGGDEFIVLLPDLAATPDAAATLALGIGEKIRALLEQPVSVDGQHFIVTASIGVSFFPNQGASVDNVIREADIAMYRAKEAGRNTLVFFEQDMQEGIEARYALERDLKDAVRLDQFALYVQPQVDATGVAVGAEALLRWNHPRLGLVLPGVFIHLAEESGQIGVIGEWVLREACRLIGRLGAAGHRLRIAVNVSPHQFHQTSFVGLVQKILAETGADPTCLTLEITENLLLAQTSDVVARMLELAELGLRFSIDDFGTGYSSLAYLKSLPLDELKIDRSFVCDIPDDANDVALVETILSMAHNLGFDVVAEGVETHEQFAFLAARGCDLFQGYLFHRPRPAWDWFDSLGFEPQAGALGAISAAMST